YRLLTNENKLYNKDNIMQVNITGHHVEITETLRDYVNQKLEKVHKRFARITNVHVILTVDSKTVQKAEAKIHVPKAEIVAEHISDDMYAAIDQMIDKLDRQVIKYKEKMNSHDDGEL